MGGGFWFVFSPRGFVDGGGGSGLCLVQGGLSAHQEIYVVGDGTSTLRLVRCH